MDGDIVVVGTGGMGREAAAWCRAAEPSGGPALAGFLDDDPARAQVEVDGRGVLGGLSWLRHHPDVGVVVAVGAPAARRRVAEGVARFGNRLHTLVHPAAAVGPSVTVAAGAILGPGVVVTRDVAVGRCAIVNFGAVLGHDGTVGDYAFVGPNASLAGNVTVGDAAEIGIGATVMQGTTLGDGATVGAGAAVIDDVSAGATVVGVPARPLEQP